MKIQRVEPDNIDIPTMITLSRDEVMKAMMTYVQRSGTPGLPTQADVKGVVWNPDKDEYVLELVEKVPYKRQ